MFTVKQGLLGNGTSVFRVFEDGKQINAFVGDSKSDKEMEKWLKELNKDELKKEGSGRRKRTSKQTP